MKKLFLKFFILILITSCNTTKNLVDGEYLLTKNYIYVDSVRNRSNDLQKYILQKPNTRFLDIPFSLHLHNLGNNNKPKTSSLWGKKNPRSYKFIKNIFSEKQSIAYANFFINLNNWFLKFQSPKVLDYDVKKKTADNLNRYYKTRGYFNSKVSTKINMFKNKKATVEYHINKGKPTFLDTIKIKIESPVLDSIYKNHYKTSFLKPGEQYNDSRFRKEANRIVKLFRNNGIYNFRESALGFYVDSTRVDNKTNVDFLISGNVLEEKNRGYVKTPFKIHKIKEINVITDYSYTKKGSVFNDTITYNGINFFAYDKIKHNPKYLSQSIFFKPNEIYKDTLKKLTRNRLKSLKNFKSTNIKFSNIKSSEGNLKMDIFLVPSKKYSLDLETEITHSNIRNIGSRIKFSITNRNAFRGSELLKLSFLGSYFNSNNLLPGWEIGADASLEIPRIFAPFGLSKLIPKEMSPRTLFSVGSTFQKNIGLDRQTITLFSDFRWKPSFKKTIQIEIFNTQYVQNLNINSYFNIYSSEFKNLKDVAKVYDSFKNTNYFTLLSDVNNQNSEALKFINVASKDTDFQSSNPEEYNMTINILNRYNIVTSDFLIPTLAYSYTYNNQTGYSDNSFSFFKIRISNSGNFLGFISKEKNNNNKTTFLKIPLAQYFKIDTEYKKFWSVGINSIFGFRTFIGAIIPYQNSDIPFTKSYFAGGSNDIRAWQTYDLGPGSRNTGLEFNVGSLKFLTNFEYRFNIISKLKGALFVDAGNIWDITGSDFIDSDSKFTGFSSLEDIAIGSGFGIRLDFNFLTLRFDIGFKTYEPYLDDSKWFKNYNFTNAVYNIGINYPF